MFKIHLHSFKYFNIIFTLNTMYLGHSLAVGTCKRLDIIIAAEMEPVTDNLSSLTNSPFLLNIDDIFKANWNHSDVCNICPPTGDSKLILIIIDCFK